jgi:hypothetical protein
MPLCHLEVVGYPRLESHNGKPIIILSIKVNINQKSPTIEEVLSQRKNIISALGQRVSKEIKFDLQLIQGSKPYELEESPELRTSLEEISVESPDWFNSDHNFLAILKNILKKKEEAIIKCVTSRLSQERAQVCKVQYTTVTIEFYH